MATLSGTLTLADIAKRMDPQGKPAVIAEMLNQTNDVIKSAEWIPGNREDGHQYTQRTALPATTWATVNTGVAPTNSSTAQGVEATGILKTVSETAEDVANFGGNLSENLMSEARAHIEAMGQEWAQTLFYGNNTTVPTEFHGFAPRYNSTTGVNGQNIISAGGTGSDNSSIWLVGWAKGKVSCFYPKGSQAGLKQDYRGKVTVDTTAGVGSGGARLLVYQTFFSWACGLAIEDWRYVVRIPNIDISALVAKSSAADLRELMFKATVRIPMLTACKPVFYMNRTTLEYLAIQGRDDVQTGGGMRFDNVDGQRVASFMGIPCETVDMLTEAEAQVT